MDQNLSDEAFIEKLVNDKAFRMKVVRESHYWFLHYYFPDYITSRTADFQKEIIAFTEDDSIRNLVITAFRGSGKSSIVTLSYAIWSILGRHEKKFAVILGHTQDLAQTHMQNIKYQLETNVRLRADLGPFREEKSPWGSQMLTLPQYRARIAMASTDQSIRGMRNNQYRPDLFIADDIEDLDSVKTLENRNGMYEWFTRDILPAGAQNARTIFIGTPLHPDSVLMRLKKNIETNKSQGVFRSYPFFDEGGVPLWKEKFATKEDIDKERGRVMNEVAWQNEYLLNFYTEENQVVKAEWIKRYETAPERKSWDDYRFTIMSIDPAVEDKKDSDYTGVVFADVFGSKESLKIYMHKRIINKRMEFPDIINLIKAEAGSWDKEDLPFKIVVETVGAQAYIYQQAKESGIDTIEYKPNSISKVERLTGTTKFMQDGVVLFPEGDEVDILLNQMLYFGQEKHDDVMDAFTMLVHAVKEIDRNEARLITPKAEEKKPTIESARDFRDNPDLAHQLERQAEMDFYRQQMNMRRWG